MSSPQYRFLHFQESQRYRICPDVLPSHTGDSCDSHYPLYGVFLPLVSERPSWVTTLIPHHVPTSSSGSETPLCYHSALYYMQAVTAQTHLVSLDQNTHDTLSQV